MADQKYDATRYRKMGPREEDIVQDTMQSFSQRQLWRNTTAAQWEEVAELILPTSRNTFMFGNYNWPGQKKTDRQVDASGMLALGRFAAICDSLLTPRNMTWHGLEPNDEVLKKNRRVKLWFEDTTRRLFKYRYSPTGNFSAQNQQIYQSLGAFGTSSMFIDAFDGSLTGDRGIRYKALPLGETFFQENHQGIIDDMIRWFRLTPRQAWQKFKDSEYGPPEQLIAALEQQSETPFNFLHRVCPRNDYDSDRLDARGKLYTSQYISLEGRCLISEGGYRKFPVAASRYDQTPGEVYGRSPAMMVLPALKTLNAEKRTFLKQGHRAADPVLLTADDGVLGMSLRPGAINKGGMSSDGKPLVGILPTGNIQTTIEMMQEEKSLINDAFLVTLFQVLTETPTMTATEVIERTNEKGILLAPTVGRQQSEYLGPMIDRELDVLVDQGLLAPMPPELSEAKGEYHVVYSSPLSRAQRAQEAAGFMRTLSMVQELVNITQDPSILDPFDFDTAIPAIAEIQSVPESWMADPKDVAQKRQNRAQQQAKQQQIQAAPAVAALTKAHVAAATAGVSVGGQPPASGQGQGQQ